MPRRQLTASDAGTMPAISHITFHHLPFMPLTLSRAIFPLVYLHIILQPTISATTILYHYPAIIIKYPISLYLHHLFYIMTHGHTKSPSTTFLCDRCWSYLPPLSNISCYHSISHPHCHHPMPWPLPPLLTLTLLILSSFKSIPPTVDPRPNSSILAKSS